jgi:hypothetical protein
VPSAAHFTSPESHADAQVVPATIRVEEINNEDIKFRMTHLPLQIVKQCRLDLRVAKSDFAFKVGGTRKMYDSPAKLCPSEGRKSPKQGRVHVLHVEPAVSQKGRIPPVMLARALLALALAGGVAFASVERRAIDACARVP